jgi:hypothetical protein
LLETCEERDNSATEARSDGDVCSRPKTAAADSIQDDDLGGIVDQLQRLIIDTPQDHIHGLEPRDVSEHGSSGPRSGIDATDHRGIQLGSDTIIQESEQMYFDPNVPPSACVPDLNFGDGPSLELLSTYY